MDIVRQDRDRMVERLVALDIERLGPQKYEVEVEVLRKRVPQLIGLSKTDPGHAKVDHVHVANSRLSEPLGEATRIVVACNDFCPERVRVAQRPNPDSTGVCALHGRQSASRVLGRDADRADKLPRQSRLDTGLVEVYPRAVLFDQANVPPPEQPVDRDDDDERVTREPEHAGDGSPTSANGPPLRSRCRRNGRLGSHGPMLLSSRSRSPFSTLKAKGDRRSSFPAPGQRLYAEALK